MRSEREVLHMKVNGWIRMEEISWRQKSRVSWLKEWDQNTKFFHNMVNLRSKANLIERLKRRDHCVMGRLAIVNMISSFYRDFFSDPIPFRPKLRGLNLRVIYEE